MMRKKELERIFKTIEEYKMIHPGMRLLARVSGGADSVCLLYALKEYRKQVPFSLKVIHVEHGIRGEESLGDARWVDGLCREWEIPCRVVHCKVEKIAAEEKISLEEAGRKVRYEIFEKERKLWQGDRVAVAHNQGDQAETVLFRLARGSGLKGLGGIRPVQGRIIRPLLFLSREEIERILEERGIGWRTDRTNLETEYTRNRIRLEILPALESQVNSRASRHIAQAALRLQEVWEYLQVQTDLAEEKCIVPEMRQGGQSWVLKLLPFFQEPELIQKELLRRCVKKCTGGLTDVGSVHLEALERLTKLPCGRECFLPGEGRAVREKDSVRFRKAPALAEGSRKNTEELLLAEAGVKHFQGMKVQVDFPVRGETAPEKILEEKKYTKWLACDTIDQNLCLRTRRTGDYLVVNESGGRKKLKDYLIDLKIPRDQRDRIWLVAQGSHVLWVVGYRISEAAKVRENTYRVLKIQIEEEAT